MISDFMAAMAMKSEIITLIGYLVCQDGKTVGAC